MVILCKVLPPYLNLYLALCTWYKYATRPPAKSRICIMYTNDLKSRTFYFAVNVAKLAAALPNSTINRAYSGQIVRCSASVGANYRAALRAKSNADFINKLKIVEEESDETVY